MASGEEEKIKAKKPTTVYCYSRECTIKRTNQQARGLQPMQESALGVPAPGAAWSAARPCKRFAPVLGL